MSTTTAAPARPSFHTGASGSPAHRSPLVRFPFWSVMRRIVMAAALLHLAFLLLFTVLGVRWLALANVGSVAALLLSYALLGRRRNGLAGWLLLAEILIHAGLAVALVGADGGFQYHVLLLVLPMTLVMKGRMPGKIACVAALGLYFCALDALPRLHAPQYVLHPHALGAMRYFNIACMAGIMAFFSLTYARLIRRAETTLQAMATTDPLTGLNNRREMLEIISRTPRREDVAGAAHCVLLCDIDHFKAINDTHGHEAGDSALQMVGSVLTASLREQDAVARWGGEEFMVLVRDADQATALQAAERLRRAVAATPVPVPVRDAAGALRAAIGVRLTMTVGVAQAREGEAIGAVIARADAALYRGKAAGRNRVEMEATPDGATSSS